MSLMTQRVLLIGGPKHGELVMLAEGQLEYEFTSMQTLLPQGSNDAFANWPASGTHLYKLDRELSPHQHLTGSGLSTYTSHVNIFTHEVLWGSPVQGGFNLWALSDALRLLEKAKDDLRNARDAQTRTTNDKKLLDSQIDDWQEKHEKLLDYTHGLEDMLRSVRQNLEIAGQAVWAGIGQTGLEYESPFDAD